MFNPGLMNLMWRIAMRDLLNELACASLVALPFILWLALMRP